VGKHAAGYLADGRAAQASEVPMPAKLNKYKKITQRSSRSFSRWYQLDDTLNLGCCDCGLTHVFQFKVKVARGRMKLFMRLRRHKSITHARRNEKRYLCRPSKTG
jgi:hypothetical protein